MSQTSKETMTNMTQGPPLRLIVTFALPLILGNFLQQFYTVADAVVVGRGVGFQALAAVGASDWIYWMMLWMLQSFAAGFSILIAQSFGAGDRRSLRKNVTMSVLICAVLAVLFTAGGLLAARPMLRLLATPADILPDSWAYLQIIFSGIPVILAYNMSASILRALGDGKTPLVAIGIAACVNVALDLLFIYVFGWGIRGAAMATVAAQIFSFLYCLRVIGRIGVLQMQREDWRFDPAIVRGLLRVGVPLGLTQGVIAIGGMVVQSVVNGMGTLYVAAFTTGNKLLGVLECTAISLGFSMSTYMGQNYGAKRLDRIRSGMRQILKLTVILALVMTAAMLLAGRALAGLFVSGSAAEVDQVIGVAYRYLSIMSIFLLSLYLLHIYRASLQGFGNALAPSISCFVEFSMRVGVSLVLTRAVGEGAIFYAEVAAWTAAALQLAVSYYWEVGRLKGRFAAGGENTASPGGT